MNALRFMTILLLCLSLVPLVGCKDPTQDMTRARVEEIEEEEPAPAENGGEVETVEAEEGTEGETPEATPEADVTTYVFSEHETYIGFTGYKQFGQHSGQFIDFEGKITVPDEDLDRAQIEVTIDTTTMDTDNSILTTVLRGGDFFAIEQYPTAKFVSTAINETGNSYEVTGNMTIRGNTKRITFPADIRISGNRLTGSAEFTINRKDWGFQTDTYLGDTIIRENVLLMFEVTAVAEDE